MSRILDVGVVMYYDCLIFQSAMCHIKSWTEAVYHRFCNDSLGSRHAPAAGGHPGSRLAGSCWHVEPTDPARVLTPIPGSLFSTETVVHDNLVFDFLKTTYEEIKQCHLKTIKWNILLQNEKYKVT